MLRIAEPAYECMIEKVSRYFDRLGDYSLPEQADPLAHRAQSFRESRMTSYPQTNEIEWVDFLTLSFQPSTRRAAVVCLEFTAVYHYVPEYNERTYSTNIYKRSLCCRTEWWSVVGWRSEPTIVDWNIREQYCSIKYTKTKATPVRLQMLKNSTKLPHATK